MSNAPVSTPHPYRWAAQGDISAFFGLMLDNVVNLAVLAGILIGAFGFPAQVVYGRMFPGTALGVLVGDGIYTWLAFRLARTSGRSEVTAMPLGLDSPSTIGMALTVLGPAFIAAKQHMSEDAAAVVAWEVGMAAMVLMGAFKLAMSFVGERVRAWVPSAGLLGSIAGVGVALLGTLQLGAVFGAPVVGMLSFGIILYALVARVPLPRRVPPVLASVVAGAVVFYVMRGMAFIPPAATSAHALLEFHLPLPTLGFLAGMPSAFREYLPLAFPFAILTVVGGINCTESARAAGDAYRTRDVLLTEALATLVAGVCGGVAQTTPYFGHPAYKAMGARAAYTLATGLFICLGGIFGYLAVLADLLPLPALAPILVFIGLEIAGQAYTESPRRHIAAVTLAMLPSVAQLVLIFLSQVHGGALLGAVLDPAGTATATGLGPAFIATCGVMLLLGHGFILTAILWGGALAFVIDQRPRRAAACMFVCAVLTLFGVMHSVTPSGSSYLPWNMNSNVPWHWAAGYGLLTLLLASARENARENRSTAFASSAQSAL